MVLDVYFPRCLANKGLTHAAQLLKVNPGR